MRAKGKKIAPREASSRPPVKSSSGSALEARVDALAEILRRHELNEIEVEEGGVRIYVRRGGGEPAGYFAPPPPHPGHPPPPPPLAHAPAHEPSGGPPTSSSTETGDGNVAYVTSPFVGTFYRSPSPETAPFVDVGTRVKKGQVLCIVEAMKLMNEIESEIEGTILQILVENGQAVEYGEPLFKIKVG
jgi:acetyl-CoA carboxylase biotin carboxyl carrier protein